MATKKRRRQQWGGGLPSVGTGLVGSGPGVGGALAKPSPFTYGQVTDPFGLPGVDPALGYQSGAANRGLGYSNEDYNTQWGGVGTGGLEALLASQPQDLQAANPDGSFKYGRGIRDYFSQQGQINTAYNNQNSDLHGSYENLANNQRQSITQSGLEGGGALAQAMQKRSAHLATDQTRLDASHNQSLSDLLTGATRGSGDAYTTLQRAVGENAPYQATLATQASGQAAPGLVDNPNYEVVGNTIYTKHANGSVKAVGTTKKKLRPIQNPASHSSWGGTANRF